MNKSGQFVVAGLLLAVIGGALVFALQSKEEDRKSEDFPDGTVWMCLDCDDGFGKTIDELGAFYAENPGAPVPCPKCSGTRTGRGKQCPHDDCRKYFAKPFPKAGEAGRYICPRCRKVLPSLHEGH